MVDCSLGYPARQMQPRLAMAQHFLFDVESFGEHYPVKSLCLETMTGDGNVSTGRLACLCCQRRS